MNILGYETLRLLILTSAVFSFCAKMYIPEKDVVTFWKTGGKFVLFLRRFAYYNSKLRNEKCPPYPDDWEKINKAFVKEERKTKPGKSHPMPNPDKYLENTYKVVKT